MSTDFAMAPGTMFDIINYNTLDDLESFISGLSKEQALYCLMLGVKSAHQRGAFTLEESETLSKSIRLLSLKNVEK